MTARPGGPLAGRIAVPGDKSMSHRALMLGALAEGETRIEGLLEGEDVLSTAGAMAALGAEVERLGDGRWRVVGRGVGRLAEPAQPLDFGNAGTGARLCLGLIAQQPIFAVLVGDASLSRRPMGRVTEPLARIGAHFLSRAGGRLPLAIRGAEQPQPISYRLPVASAQVKSALLLAGLAAEGTTEVIEPEATRDHTENMLRAFGATVTVSDEADGRHVRLAGPARLTAAPVTVPGDISSAAFPLVAALVVPGSSVVIENVGVNPLRTGLLDCLAEMGAGLRLVNRRDQAGEPVADLVAEAGPLKGIVVPPERAPSMIDEYPILAVAAAFAEGRTELRGLGELRVKESDRLAATARGLAACGVAVEEGEDWLVVHGLGGSGRRPAGGARIEANLDHRIAMAFLVLGLAAAAPVEVDDASPIDTSFPGFAALLRGLGADLA
ncbi:3-phosphoshikimate 1-carboxyvinyltransferase [Tistlia consotensis]|uniref:3-phosphoshikimate 1-carboxyvinyltransferase n=1 Tax=Tistlia consotensis USBA 355 TaxID=560819 RepID=A0A1Y6B525_9PROT|nr:3-phosphoshikimate 1-carboxyvinyltransferase [Tistlia consotensis]SME92534.1 3-phosphoshikimate 1-carboxyvinyltransferase [Tistlia consotensis USBA 355]SNR28092.1 3-phosphoshikimate 1-carboxyvinyltransferase [Tistlia consotensis]